MSHADIANSERERRAERFLLAVAIATLVYCIAGFSLRAATDAATFARLSFPLILHATLMTGWLLLFVSQVWLKHAGRVETHMRHGRMSWPLAVAIVLVGTWITYLGSNTQGPAFFVLNEGGVVNFGILYALAVRAALAGRFESHKRFMLVATITFIGPATARYVAVLGALPPLAILSLPLVVIGIPLTYDLIVRGRWHRASIGGAAITLAMLVAGVALAASFGFESMATPSPQ